jgi:type VI secretion system protein ImpM
MMMSVDRVGRQFPLTLASPLPDGAAPLAAHFAGVDALASLEEVALDALEDGFTREMLSDRLKTLALPPAAPHFNLTEAQGGLVLTEARSQGLAAELAGRYLERRFRKPSIWSVDLEGTTRLMVCEGLPAGGQMTGLFDMTAQVWHSMEDA